MVKHNIYTYIYIRVGSLRLQGKWLAASLGGKSLQLLLYQQTNWEEYLHFIHVRGI